MKKYQRGIFMRKSFYFIFFYKHTGVSVNKTGASFPPTALNNERCEQTKIREKNVFISSHWVFIPSLVQKREALACYNFYFGSKTRYKRDIFLKSNVFELRSVLPLIEDTPFSSIATPHPQPNQCWNGLWGRVKGGERVKCEVCR